MRPRAALLAAITVSALAAGSVLVLGSSESVAPDRHSPAADRRPAHSLPVPVTRGPPPATRQPASRFIAPDGADDGPCDRERPCLTLNRAYLAASPGDVVELAEGQYEEQWIPADPTKRSEADVIFRPANGEEVAVGPITFGGPRIEDFGASHLTLVGMAVEGFSTQRSRDLSLFDVTVDGNFAIQGGGQVTIVGGSVGGTDDGSHSEIAAYSDPRTVDPPRAILIDGVTFHDVRMSAPEDHVECLQATDVVGLVVRNTRFVRCDTFDLRIDRYRTDGPRDVRIENSVFQHTRDRFGGNVYYGLAVRAGHGVVIRNNSSDIAWAGPDPETEASDWVISGNAIPGGRCDERFVYRANLWDGGEACDPSDRLGAPGFADPKRGDYRLGQGSPALDLVPSRDAPAFDHQQIPRAPRPDAGAFEGRLPPRPR